MFDTQEFFELRSSQPSDSFDNLAIRKADDVTPQRS